MESEVCVMSGGIVYGMSALCYCSEEVLYPCTIFQGWLARSAL